MDPASASIHSNAAAMPEGNLSQRFFTNYLKSLNKYERQINSVNHGMKRR